MIICIVGPTGVGKSKLAIKLAQEVKGEIINGDAFQIYKGMDIGTAKPSQEERKIVIHHLFDFVDPDYEYSIFDYQKNLRNKIEELQSKNVPIIICGGSGLYLKSSLYDFVLNENKSGVDMSSFEKMSNEELHNYLTSIDEEESQKIHMNNRKRVLRAIEIYLQEGKKKSQIINEQEHKLIYDVTFVGLSKEREELYDLINKRVDLMFADGLVDEVKKLINKYSSSLRSFQAIGYKEIIDGLAMGSSEEEMKELIKKNSRNYAKRQFTYFKHQMDVNWFSDCDEAYRFSIKKLGENYGR
ncbi:MAG: tRNA (adenosine(37)-N6)-dimethylallyltransferase MiaA [Bacilli bacterium]